SGPGSRWQPPEQAFREATSKWGLDAMDVEGVRLSVADIDDDGWPDLSVRRAGTHRDDFRPGGTRASWLLRNDEGRGFQDVTRSSGFVTPRDQDPNLGRPVEVVIWADVDNDGDVDAFTGVSTTESTEHTPEPGRNDGRGKFVRGPGTFAARQPGLQATVAAAGSRHGNPDGRV